MNDLWTAAAALAGDLWSWLGEPTPFLVVTTLVKIGIALGIIFTFAPLMVWAERRQSAMIQDRIGPVRAGIPLPFAIPVFKNTREGWGLVWTRELRMFGLLHPMADALKMIWKEDFVPPNADKFLHAAAPIVALVPALATIAIVPFGDTVYLDLLGQQLDPSLFAGPGAMHALLTAHATHSTQLQIASVNVGVLYIFGIAGTGVVGAALAGYASDNKFSLLGGMRAAGQMVSYEVTLGLALVPMFMLYDSLLLDRMVHAQASGWWGIARGGGVGVVAFFMFFAASVAEAKRIPFDVPEGESELVGGYFTEYSGLKFGMFFTGEFAEVVVSSALIITIFLGGYSLPWLQMDGLHLDVMGWYQPMAHWAVTVLQILTFVIKLVLMVWFQLMVRWTLPRFRYDQIMKLCWKVLLPVSLVNILIAGLFIQLWPRW